MPDANSYKSALREVYKNYGPALSKAKKLKKAKEAKPFRLCRMLTPKQVAANAHAIQPISGKTVKRCSSVETMFTISR